MRTDYKPKNQNKRKPLGTIIGTIVSTFQEYKYMLLLLAILCLSETIVTGVSNLMGYL